jgi:hypothetical protein
MALFITIFSTTSMAQGNLNGHSGLYMTASDFTGRKLSYAIDVTKETHTIRADKLFGQSTVDIIHEGKKYSFEKKNVFGYRDVHNKDFRFFNNKEYEILDGTFFYLYQYHTYVSNGKTQVQKPAYFISKEVNSSIIPLTLDNLKNFFPNNHKFHDMLDAAFKTDEGLNAYDTYHKTYKIKHLYSQSLK